MGDEGSIIPSGLRRKASLNVSFSVKKEKDKTHLKVAKILQKPEDQRTDEEKELLSKCSDIVKLVNLKLEKRKKLQARAEEFEDGESVLKEKCRKLAEAIQKSQHLVVYSGAGVSTAASIPDYRGSNGIWTRLQQGKDIGNHDLSVAEPTLAHMALFAMFRRGLLKYVVSQNCDGLHLRSGLPRRVLSEVHGNMNLEVCNDCNIQVWRSFDVTQHTARYAHHTARRCSQCCQPLKDTIVHFGERGSLAWPINWSGACQAAKQADMILCIGSSLKVLKKYPWLWGMDKPVKKRPQLYIVNLQWTPKDDQASLKINGKCDDVMRITMEYLGIPVPKYDRKLDPIFTHATLLHELEEHTTSTQMLVSPEVKSEPTDENMQFEPINENKIEKIVSDIKKEKDIWRPFSNEITIVPNGECKTEPELEVPSQSMEVSEGFSVQVDIFDKVYQEIAKKILKETNVEYYNKIYEEPLDLTKPKTECDFCMDVYGAPICLFYLKRETKLPPSGPVCYCCDSDDDNTEPTSSTEPGKKVPTNPGWFGKGYKKKIKKKR
ncbi:NAD-dependent protein deacetylase sirtuin-7 [Cimex lectularius]|uniref:protein acetyllysine N-acetyltransferase n=1 Tax=Cimex lectularius TaxID=79782 RepID=A0A8I6RIG3_CIMLE|nr:NAD-dependent protein deacetylase sirtuin-7 [Cimex lectularius]